MARCFLTGIQGFIGTWLASYLVETGHEVAGLARASSVSLLPAPRGVKVTRADILDREKIFETVRDFKPDYVFHLAAQSSPSLSWEKPEITFDINVQGTLNVLEAVRASGLSPVIEVFLSSSEYASGESDKPIKEDHALEPSSPYGVSKLAAGQLAVLYEKRYGMKIVRVRPFFLIGPGKKDDVSSRFCRQIALIEAGRGEVMKTGNLAVVRDFLDVRDGAEALWFAASKGQSGEVYNIASGEPCPVEKLLKLYLSHARKKIRVETDPALFRPLDEPFKVGDVTRLKALGWKPRRRLEETTLDILNDWRTRALTETGV